MDCLECMVTIGHHRDCLNCDASDSTLKKIMVAEAKRNKEEEKNDFLMYPEQELNFN